MAHLKRRNCPEIELWNVSLLPTVRAVPPEAPPQGPAPHGGHSLRAPALLAVLESAAPVAAAA